MSKVSWLKSTSSSFHLYFVHNGSWNNLAARRKLERERYGHCATLLKKLKGRNREARFSFVVIVAICFVPISAIIVCFPISYVYSNHQAVALSSIFAPPFFFFFFSALYNCLSISFCTLLLGWMRALPHGHHQKKKLKGRGKELLKFHGSIKAAGIDICALDCIFVYKWRTLLEENDPLSAIIIITA